MTENYGQGRHAGGGQTARENAAQGDKRSLGILALVLIVLLAMTSLTTVQFNTAAKWVSHTHDVQDNLSRMLSVLQDAETGQRGYLLTGNASYLKPYNAAVESYQSVKSQLRDLTANDPFQQARIDALEVHIVEKLDELAETISLYDAGRQADALSLVKTDQGKLSMDAIRGIMAEMYETEEALLEVRLAELERTKAITWLVISFVTATSLVAAVVVFLQTEKSRADRSVLEASLRVAAEEARKANDAKSAFLANMSHEIRTPLNGIMGMTELLKETKLSSEQRIFSNTIVNSSEALLTIINDILDFSKIEAEKIVLYEDVFSLRTIVHEVSSLLQTKAADKGIEICIDIPSDFPCWFTGDAGRIRQVLLNLAGNAVKFTHSGHVEIRLKYDAKTQQSVEITVVDTGVGIPDDRLEAIFLDFEQVGEQLSHSCEGTGLGLAITQRIVDLMGGSIDVRSRLGVGSSFVCKLTLPVADTPQDIAPNKAAKLGLSALVGCKIVCVDDLEINRDILKRRLEALGMHVTCLDGGAAFLNYLKQDPDIDIAIFDNLMPDMSGEALIRAYSARTNGQVPPVILHTAAYKNIGIEHFLQQGFAKVLFKPARTDALKKTLVSALDIRGETQANNPPLSVALDDPSEPMLNGLNILVAEDNRVNQLVIKKFLAKSGCTMRFVENGERALSAYQARVPDLVLMDVSMPIMDGLEATQCIRKWEVQNSLAPCPIIALTANAMETDRETCLAAGMTDFLTKPMRKERLVRKLNAGKAASQLPSKHTPQNAARSAFAT